MLGADLLGFQTQVHCNNFLESCDRYLEARVDWDRFSVTMGDQETLVRAFPIGIETPPVKILSKEEILRLRSKYGVTAQWLAVGVDRLDYTKGLLERIDAVSRFLENYPSFRGKFSLLQVGSPSRSSIPAYRSLENDLVQAVERVNAKFGSESYRPVILLASHHDHDEIQDFYQMGDLCMVTSLHDGMNLVAKEYVWSQAPERGMLILSRFAGAARELTEALIVNPYSIEEISESILKGITMDPVDRTRRMRAMRRKIASHNVFHWANDLISCLIQERSDPLRPGFPQKTRLSPLDLPSSSR